MKHFLIIFTFFYLIFLAPCNAEISDNFRSYLVRFLGQDMVFQVLGDSKTYIIPNLPKIQNCATCAVKTKLQKICRNVPVKIHIDDKFNYYFLREVYDVVRAQKATENDIARWMNTLKQGASREGVYRALVLDGMYYSMERNVSKKVNKPTIDFTVKFLKKFINKKIDKSALSRYNIFSLKRKVTEKILEMVDQLYNASQEDLYVWYGIMSSEIAEQFQKIFTNSLRKNRSVERHINWSCLVNEQSIKSEIIIKIHKIYNSLSNHN